ncbi:oxygenase MpaB family protein [Enemella sp. A6]|uniref:oxygenase MpaB family protein n=1 Tax=Enemella sp. A6 TaxID=3440152 RepID=UPI003EBDE92B
MNLRRRLGEVLRDKVAGPDHAERADRIWGTSGPRWFAPGDPIWTVNRAPTMYPAGICALLLQSLHPSAMAGVADHSGYRGDPWGRLQRISDYIATTTYGVIDDAEAMIAQVRRIHTFITGTRADGVAYAAGDPHLLRWVHVAEIYSFLTAHQTWMRPRLTPAEADRYVAQAGLAAGKLGAEGVPTSVRELRDQLEGFVPELALTPAAADTARFLLREAPLPAPALPGYWMIAAGGIWLLPRWARDMLDFRAPTPVWTLAHGLGRTATAVLGWALLTPEIAEARQVPSARAD